MNDLSTKIYNSVLSVKKKLGSLVVSATLKVFGPPTYDETTGTKSSNISDKDIEVVMDKFNSFEIDDIQVKATDIKLLMFNNDDYVPSVKDKVVFSGNTYEIVKVNPISAGTKVVIFMLQLRK